MILHEYQSFGTFNPMRLTETELDDGPHPLVYNSTTKVLSFHKYFNKAPLGNVGCHAVLLLVESYEFCNVLSIGMAKD